MSARLRVTPWFRNCKDFGGCTLVPAEKMKRKYGEIPPWVWQPRDRITWACIMCGKFYYPPPTKHERIRLSYLRGIIT